MSTTTTIIQVWYQLFFHYIEPCSAVLGAYFSIFRQSEYLALTHAPSAPTLVIPLGTSIALNQLGNLYFYFALVEALVLRSTKDIKVWRALMIAMLIADFGHLYSVGTLGWEVYYDVANYNAIDWGNVPFVYAGAITRSCFLLKVGLGKRSPAQVRAEAAAKKRNRATERSSELDFLR